MPIKAVLFDLDDTLYGTFANCDHHGNLASGGYVERTLGISAQQYIDTLMERKQRILREKWGRPESHNRMLSIKETLEHYGINPIPYAEDIFEVYWAEFLCHMKPFDGVPELLEDLRGAEIPVGICTNMTICIQMRKLRRLGIAALCGHLVTSEEVGADKPAREIFRVALERLGARPEETLMVGDHPYFDMKGALECGLVPLWLNTRSLERAPDEPPVMEAKTFAEADRTIRRYCGIKRH